MWSPKTGIVDADLVLKEYNLKKLHLKSKEGLCLINGTQFITALGADAVERAIKLALQADVIAALTVEVLKGVQEQIKIRSNPGNLCFRFGSKVISRLLMLRSTTLGHMLAKEK